MEPIKQTAAEQAALIVELADMFAVSSAALGVDSLREQAQYSLADLTALTASLQASGFLPQTNSGVSAPSTQSKKVQTTRAAWEAAKKWLVRSGKAARDNIKKHGWKYVAAGTAIYSVHAYMTEDQQIALDAERERTKRFSDTLRYICDPQSPGYNPQQCGQATSTAIKELSKAPSGGGSQWLVWIAVGAAVVVVGRHYYDKKQKERRS